MKKTTLSLISFMAIAVLALTMFSCAEDPPDPPTVTIFASVEGYVVAFTSTVTNTDSYSWEFGDGTVSAEQNPVHTYDVSGTYTATLTVTGEGGTANASTEVTIEASELEMLTGGSAMANGKTWMISQVAGVGDGIYKNPPDWEVEMVIPSGMLVFIGLPSEYNDEFTFKYDMTYTHNTENDSALTDFVFAFINQLEYRPSLEEAVVLAPFTTTGATFTYTEDTNLTLEMTHEDDPNSTSEVTWNNVTVLEIEGGTEFVGLWDFTRKYVIHDISVDHLQIDMFMSGTEGSKANYPSHMLRLTFIPKE
jgi:PKD repeat protein